MTTNNMIARFTVKVSICLTRVVPAEKDFEIYTRESYSNTSFAVASFLSATMTFRSFQCHTPQVACFDNTIMASSYPNITNYFTASDFASWLLTCLTRY